MGPYWKFTGYTEHDDGRFEITQAESDKYLFRVPTLRNVERTYPYFHDGSVHSLTGEVNEEARVLPILPASVFEAKGINQASSQ